MLNFNQPFRSTTVYGPNTINQLGDYITGVRILFVYGSGSIKTNNIYNTVTNILDSHYYLEFGGISSNPKLSKIREAITICKEQQIDQIIAVGGGSVIDAAKAIAIGAKSKDDIWSIYQGDAKITDSIDLLTIVTNVATGSETNDVSVIVNDQINLKRSIKNIYAYPKVAIMDPMLTLSVGEYTTRYGLIDCFSHLFEQFFNNIDNPIIDDQIAGYMRNIVELAPKLLADLQNPELRDMHMYLSYVAYNCEIRNIVGGDFACHGLDYGLASVFDTTHGAGLAIIMPNWIKYVRDHKPDKIAKLGVEVFGVVKSDLKAEAKQTEEALRGWLLSLNAASTYQDIDVSYTKAQLDEMVEKAKVSYPLGNYYKLDTAAIKTIYEMGN